jgi:hypothetical protein
MVTLDFEEGVNKQFGKSIFHYNLSHAKIVASTLFEQ